jgi:hypothetical protein
VPVREGRTASGVPLNVNVCALAPGAIAELRRSGATLELEVTGPDTLYVPAGKWVSLTLVARDEFELATPRADRLHIDRDARGRVVGLTLNPGPWPIHARRLPAG